MYYHEINPLYDNILQSTPTHTPYRGISQNDLMFVLKAMTETKFHLANLNNTLYESKNDNLLCCKF